MTILTEKQQKLLPKLEPANINPASFLATDYLNHFNEMLMMLEMLPDMPDILEDLDNWAPKSYPEHFEESGFAHKELAIEAYEIAPIEIKAPFDETINSLDELITTTLAGLHSVGIIERGFSAPARMLIEARIETMHALLQQLNGIIHGNVAEDETEAAPHISEQELPEGDMQSQGDIDKLFD